MTPPHEPNKGSNIFPGNRYPFWACRSDNHPRVQSRPGEITDGMNTLIADLRRLRSPSPDMGEFSRFSSRPSTPPDTSTQHPPSQHPFLSYPPPLPPTAYQHLPPPPPPLFPVYSHPPPPHLISGQPPTSTHPHPSQIHYTQPPPLFSSGNFQGQQGEYSYVDFCTDLPPFTEAPKPTIVSVSFPVNSGMIGVAATMRTCSWDTKKPFSEFWLQMCANMQLDPQTAVIGYKISGDRVKDAAREISSEEDYVFAMETILKKTQNARSKTHTLVLQNLVSV